jgi:hypothetical protein
MAEMVIVEGVRYRADDAKRLGLTRTPDPKPEPDEKARSAANKSRGAHNKAGD